MRKEIVFKVMRRSSCGERYNKRVTDLEWSEGYTQCIYCGYRIAVRTIKKII